MHCALYFKMADVLRESLQNKLRSICQTLQDQNDLDKEYILESVEDLLKDVVTLDSVERVSENVFRCLFEAHDKLYNKLHQSSTAHSISDGVGRPLYDIPEDQLDFLVECNFMVKDISNMFGVSKRTIERRMREFGITKQAKITLLTDEDLDKVVGEIKETFPNCVSKMLVGYLRSRQIRIQRHRVRDALHRIDPVGVIAHRRNYNVSRPLGLWHLVILDGNHQLIKWRFVIHGCVDGYSRIPVYLACRDNNQADTVLQLFLKAVVEWGLPSRIRSDKGEKMLMLLSICLIILCEGQGEDLPLQDAVSTINALNGCGLMYTTVCFLIITTCLLD